MLLREGGITLQLFAILENRERGRSVRLGELAVFLGLMVNALMTLSSNNGKKFI